MTDTAPAPAVEMAAPAALAALAAAGSDLGAVTRLVNELERGTPLARTVTIGLSGNVTLDLLGTYLRKHALLAGSAARVVAGTFGDHLGNARRFAAEGADALVIVPSSTRSYPPSRRACAPPTPCDGRRHRAPPQRLGLALEAAGIATCSSRWSTG
jgi:hypothetical protein